MKKLVYLLPIFALMLASCENFYLEKQLDYKSSITDVRNFAYTLTDADYSTIAKNATNVATALAMGETENDSSIYFRLQNLATDKYFADTLIAPETFIPAFLATKYPNLSSGTLCEVTYKLAADMPLVYSDFKTIRDFNSTTELTSEEDIIPALDAQVNNLMKRAGYKFIVYMGDKTYIYQCDEEKHFSPYVNETLQIFALTKADYAQIGASVVENPEVVLPIYLRNHFPYAKADDKYGMIYKSASGANTFVQCTYNGTDWELFSSIAEDVMSFEMKDVWKANISTYLSEPFLGHGQGAFVIQNVLLEDPLTYTWYYSATYGMCTSAYKNNESWNSETWLVSPIIKLKKARNPQLIFDQAFNKATNFTEECTVLVSTDYKGDVTTCTWEALPWNVLEDGSLNVPPGTTWVFQSSGDMSLQKWAGQTIYLGFRYTTSNKISGTWELQNVLVYEPQEE